MFQPSAGFLPLQFWRDLLLLGGALLRRGLGVCLAQGQINRLITSGGPVDLATL